MLTRPCALAFRMDFFLEKNMLACPFIREIRVKSKLTLLGRALNFLEVSYTATPLGFGCCLGTEFRSEMVSPGSACNFDGASHLDTVYDLPNFCFILAKA
jgi:hypothetical protein